METIKLPDSWDEITIGQYQEICSIESDDNVRRWVEIISILSNSDPEKVKLMNPVKFAQAVEHLSFILTLPSDRIFKDEIVIDGVTYKFKERLESLTVGEWLDLEAYIDDTNHNIHKTFAVLYSDGTDNIDKRSKVFKEKMMIGDVYAALVFFSLIGKESIQTIKDYLMSESERMTILEEEVKRAQMQN